MNMLGVAADKCIWNTWAQSKPITFKQSIVVMLYQILFVYINDAISSNQSIFVCSIDLLLLPVFLRLNNHHIELWTHLGPMSSSQIFIHILLLLAPWSQPILKCFQIAWTFAPFLMLISSRARYLFDWFSKYFMQHIMECFYQITIHFLYWYIVRRTLLLLRTFLCPSRWAWKNIRNIHWLAYRKLLLNLVVTDENISNVAGKKWRIS